MKPESVQMVAKAIASCDGVSNWTSYSADEQDQLLAEAQAAIRAVLQTEEVRGLVEAVKATPVPHHQGCLPSSGYCSKVCEETKAAWTRLRQALAALEGGHEAQRLFTAYVPKKPKEAGHD